jgi:hypothetical protein
LLAPVIELTRSFTAIGAFFEAGDVTGAINELINIPANVTNAVLNGGGFRCKARQHFGQLFVQAQQPVCQIARLGMANAVGDMRQTRAGDVDQPPAKVPQPRIDAQNPHPAVPSFFEGLARKGNTGQSVRRARSGAMLQLQIATGWRAKPTLQRHTPQNNDKIMNEAMRAAHGRHDLARLALHMQHS